ncbi:uncharacterized protein LOC143426133 [Xylocopa sonorina]|uniref:uncharacterized protein LOC143426133 n=1 Tax=Xylocopa sonorina TaxID=1818115 RepID=UPI00403AFABF
MEDFVPTRVSKMKKEAEKNYLVVSYEKPRKKKTEVVESEESNKQEKPKFSGKEDKESKYNDERRKQELEMKRIRYQVMKFGMSGFKGAEAENAEEALAISLGAKPQKRKGINYKILVKEKKQQKKAQKKDVTLQSGLEKSLKTFKNKNKDKSKDKNKHRNQITRRKGSESILGIYGKVSKKIVGKNKK